MIAAEHDAINAIANASVAAPFDPRPLKTIRKQRYATNAPDVARATAKPAS
jgi:hypothetical protein